MRATLLLALLTGKEAVRRRIVAAGLLLGLGFVALYNAGLHFILHQARGPAGAPPLALREIANFLFMAGMYAASILSVAMAALVTADSLAGEIASGTIQTLVARPIRRGAVVVGRWLGLAALVTLYLGLLGGGLALSVRLQAGYLAPHLGWGMALILLEALLVMTVALAASASLSTLATGAVVFGLFGIAFLGGWIEHVGAFLGNDTAVRVGVVASLVFPSEALWRRAAFEMTSRLVRAVGFSPFSAPSVPSLWMLGYAVLYLAVALAVALRRFGRRDL